MEKYHNFADLLIDYRILNDLSQLDLASLLDVDVRTVSRWERGISLVKPDKEKDFVEKLFLPYQLIRNLNAEHPIPVFYNMIIRTYSLSPMMTRIETAEWFKSSLLIDDEHIHSIKTDKDIQFVMDYRDQINKAKPIRRDIIMAAAKYLPETNLILYDQSGFYTGHICVLPLKNSSYQKIKNKEIDETALHLSDLTRNFKENTQVFYFYSIDADSFENAYYMMHRFFAYFRKEQFKDYLFAGITYRENQVELLKEMGLETIWEDVSVGG